MTSERFSLTIGGVELAVDLPPAVRVSEPDPLYATFLGSFADDRRCVVRVPVALELAPPPPFERLPVAFDTGSGWRAHRDRDSLWFGFRLGRSDEGSTAGSDDETWVARLGPDDAATVYPAPCLIERTGAATIVRGVLGFPFDQLLLMHLLPRHDGLVLHASGVRLGPSTIAFAGRSGAGKTTLLRKLTDRNDVVGLSDDRLVLRLLTDGPTVFGTPWAGTGGVARNEAGPLRAIVFLQHAAEYRMVRISAAQALRQLLPVASIPWFDEPLTFLSLRVIEQLLAQVPAFDARLRLDTEAGRILADIDATD